jgi:hypothetical protein
MELRAEPRFGTRSSGILEVIRDKVYTYEASITEVSGIGLRIEMAEELAAGENIRLVVNNYHMFARVRRCIPSESGFTIGLERVEDWNRPPSGNALVPQKTTGTSPVKILGRPKLKNPLDNLHLAALRALFADPRLRTRPLKYKAAAIAAGCMALAGWAGFGAGISLHGKPAVAAPSRTAVTKPLPGVPRAATDIAPPKTAATSLAAANIVTSKVSSPVVLVPQLQKAPVEVPPLRKAEVAAVPKLAVRPAIVPTSRISIKATDASWVTACVDGVKVLDTLLTKGYAGAIPFSRQATVRFGNAGAIELAVGNQPAAKLGSLGEARTIKATPSGYQLMTVRSAFNCTID